MRNPAVRIACPGRGAARAPAKRCIADPGPPRTVTIPDLQRIIPLRFMLRCARDTRAPRPDAASCEEPTFTCGRIRSIVSGLLFTMKTATRTCEPSARDIALARDLHAIFELDDVCARNLLVEVCSNAWAPPQWTQRMDPPQIDACASAANWAHEPLWRRRPRAAPRPETGMRLGYFTMPVHPMHRRRPAGLGREAPAPLL